MKVSIKNDQTAYRPVGTFLPGDLIETTSKAVYFVAQEAGTRETRYVLIMGCSHTDLTTPVVYRSPLADNARLFDGELTLKV